MYFKLQAESSNDLSDWNTTPERVQKGKPLGKRRKKKKKKDFLPILMKAAWIIWPICVTEDVKLSEN